MTCLRHAARAARRTLRSLRATHTISIVLVAALLAATAQAVPKVETDEEKTMYVVGMLTAQPLSVFHLTNEEIEIVLRGIRDTARGEPLPIDPEEFMPKLRILQEERTKADLAIESKESGEYLIEQSKLEGAESTPSGLIFTELEAGTGSRPKADSRVRVKYTGRLRDGSIFDAQTAEYSLNGVIPCWTEGVGRVKVGGKAKLVCPSDIAYGNAGRPPVIPPGAALTFEVELLEIVDEGAE